MKCKIITISEQLGMQTILVSIKLFKLLFFFLRTALIIFLRGWNFKCISFQAPILISQFTQAFGYHLARDVHLNYVAILNFKHAGQFILFMPIFLIQGTLNETIGNK